MNARLVKLLEDIHNEVSGGFWACGDQDESIELNKHVASRLLRRIERAVAKSAKLDKQNLSRGKRSRKSL